MRKDLEIKPELPSPLFELNIPGPNQYWIKRDDLIHPHISGNKWRKLSCQFSTGSSPSGIITFGGAFSNHILATAAFANLHKIDSIGFIRTDKLDDNNPTLDLARAYGMHLIALNRVDYRDKDDKAFLKKIENNYPNHLIIPEGGSNIQALDGYKEFWNEIENQSTMSFDIVCASWGTGSTASGLLLNIPKKTDLYIFPAIKGLSNEEVLRTLSSNLGIRPSNHQLFSRYALKGYGRIDNQLLDFALSFYQNHQILLDPIYTVKMMFGIIDLQRKEKIKKKKILIYHSGGNQGWAGIFYRNPKYIEEYDVLYKAFNQTI